MFNRSFRANQIYELSDIHAKKAVERGGASLVEAKGPRPVKKKARKKVVE